MRRGNAARASFGELIDRGVLDVTDGYRAKNSDLGGTGLIFLRAGHVTDSHIDFVGAERFHDELTPRLKEKVSEAGDVAVTTKGNSTGRTAYVTPAMRRAGLSTTSDQPLSESEAVLLWWTRTF